MTLIDLKNIEVHFARQCVFSDLSLQINLGEKIGIVGPNGCGKSTLLKIIASILEPDKGQINLRGDTEIGYLAQEPSFKGNKTVIEQLKQTQHKNIALQNDFEEAAHNMTGLSGDQLDEAMRKYDHLSKRLDIAGGYAADFKIQEVCAGLELDEEIQNKPTTTLSGGQLARLGLAKVLLQGTDLLLLDEPTNHLDWQALNWLEKFIRGYKGTVLMVSHDRFLLDRTVDKIIEINFGKCRFYTGNYSSYLSQKDNQQLDFERKLQQQRKFIAKTIDFIDRNRNQKGMQKVARGRQKHLDKLMENDLLEASAGQKTLNFNFADASPDTIRVETAISFENITQKFDDLTLFEDLSFELYNGRRLGIIGPNGTGKSTLLKIALDQLTPTSGSIIKKRGLTIGYMDQTGGNLENRLTVIDEAAKSAPDKSPEQLRSILGSFLFSGDNAFKAIENLSGGERNRLALCKLVLEQPQFLVLDEPTNHLDIPSIEALENALAQFKGAMLVVSHDRYFLDKITDRLLVIGADPIGKKKFASLEFIDGSVSQYIELLETRRTTDLKERKPAKQRPITAAKPKTPPELRKFNAWTDTRIEDEIEKTEEKIDQLQHKFADEQIYKQPHLLTQLQTDLEKAKTDLELLYRAYERRCG